ncbi:MAG TPA: hypothetical protein VGN54_05510 [Mycobacteriales bacterium]|jgi:hypothetical protein|nr:hypothetical protein [Mycobacteriales bacterium]
MRLLARLRRSTVLLTVAFLAVMALYFVIRPAPIPPAGASPTSPRKPAVTRTPTPTPTDSSTARTTPSQGTGPPPPASQPAPTPSPTPTSSLPGGAGSGTATARASGPAAVSSPARTTSTP